MVVVDQEGISLSTDFGMRQLEFPHVEPEVSAAGIRFVTETEDSRLTLMLDRQPCSDTMVDLAYPFRARYSLDGEVGVGCSGAPIDVLSGQEWFIQTIGDADIVPGTQPTIEFRIEEGEGRFAGLASCNRYMGGFELSGEGLRLSPAASTLMACADEQQALQERRLSGLLSEVYGFGIDEDGRLVLRAGGGTIIASR
jgi:heat shock protein HslJ